MQLLKIDYEKIKEQIFNYIDTHEDKKEFNKILKKIFIEETFNILSVMYTMSAILKYETEFSKVTKTLGKIISDTINSVDVFTGEKIYEYKYFVSNEEDKKVINLSVTRKDKEENHYKYHLEEIFKDFSTSIENVNESLLEMIKGIIDLQYKYAEEYIERIQKENISFDEDKFLKELIYISVDSKANEIYNIIRETDGISKWN